MAERDAGQTTQASAPVRAMNAVNQWILFDAIGGPRPLRAAWVINLQKAGSFLFFGALIAWYADKTWAATSVAAWIYLALHGSYGLVWLLKDQLFPDRSWQTKQTVPSSVFTLAGLAAYWAIGWVLIAGHASQNYPLPQALWFALCISLAIGGCVVMIAADVQKHVQLRLSPGLITDGMFRHVRHPNYTGEIMVYGAFGLLAWHWLALVVLGTIWGLMFVPNMAMKEASMSRYPAWAAYKKRSAWIIPKIL